MKTFNVIVRKAVYYSTLLKIEAGSEDEAITKGENEGAVYDFNSIDEVVIHAEIE